MDNDSILLPPLLVLLSLAVRIASRRAVVVSITFGVYPMLLRQVPPRQKPYRAQTERGARLDIERIFTSPLAG